MGNQNSSEQETVNRGLQVHRISGANHVIRFYHQTDLDDEEDSYWEYSKKLQEYREKEKESDVESNIQMPVYLDMVKDAVPFSTMTLFQGNRNITGGDFDKVITNMVSGSLHILIANRYELEHYNEDTKDYDGYLNEFSPHGPREFDWGGLHGETKGRQIYVGWYAHFDKPKPGKSRASVTYVRFYDFRDEMNKPRAERKICYVNGSDGHPVWVEGQNGQDTDRNNNNMREEPKNYDEESINNGARTLKNALSQCVNVFESTVDWWETGAYDLNRMQIDSNKSIVGSSNETIVGSSNKSIVGSVVHTQLQHPALLQAYNTHVVERTCKSPVKKRKSNRERPFNPVMRTTVQPPPKHPDLKKQHTTKELIKSMPNVPIYLPPVPTHPIEIGQPPPVPTHPIEIGQPKGNSRKRVADMVNYQMNLKF
tara:strand:- start:6 stop:1280 length:1275 start_codon:yes stop_codon:yes gene_type:complete